MDKSSATQDFERSAPSKSNNQDTHIEFRNNFDTNLYDSNDNQS